MTKFNFKETLSSRAYTLLVCWRWKKIDEEVFGSKEYHKRRVEDIQRMENVRLEMHTKAMEELTRIHHFSEKEAQQMLQDECERLIKEKIRDLKTDEIWCGCCREILKRTNWEKHQADNKLLHDYLVKELLQISREQSLLRLQMVKDNQLNSDGTRNSSQA